MPAPSEFKPQDREYNSIKLKAAARNLRQAISGLKRIAHGEQRCDHPITKEEDQQANELIHANQFFNYLESMTKYFAYIDELPKETHAAIFETYKDANQIIEKLIGQYAILLLNSSIKNALKQVENLPVTDKPVDLFADLEYLHTDRLNINITLYTVALQTTQFLEQRFNFDSQRIITSTRQIMERIDMVHIEMKGNVDAKKTTTSTTLANPPALNIAELLRKNPEIVMDTVAPRCKM